MKIIPKKSLGQNFLIDQNIITRIVNIIDIKNKNILEIGCGFGTHAQEIIKNSNECIYNGIDITNKAIEYTKKRLELFNLQGELSIADAEKLPFKENQFNFIWSWGVIHHSSDTDKILKEIRRILKPNGEAFFMVYYSGWWNYYFTGIILHGIFRLKFLKYKTLSSIMQSETDGALARYYTIRNWKKKFIDIGFSFKKIMISGNETDYLPIPGGKIKNFINNIIPTFLKIFLLSKLKMGSFLITHVKKNL